MNKENNVFYWLPCSVVFVSTCHGKTRDIMTATAMFVSEKEPLLVISVAKNHLTERLIDQTGKFTLVIAGEDQKQLAMQVGSIKGQAVDKFEKFSIRTVTGISSTASNMSLVEAPSSAVRADSSLRPSTMASICSNALSALNPVRVPLRM